MCNVQRSMEDESVIVASYEGEHNHGHGAVGKSSSSPVRSIIRGSCPIADNPIQPNLTLDLTLSGTTKESGMPFKNREEDYNTSRNCSNIEDYVVSITKDPNLMAALAAAIGQYIVEPPKPTKT
ncbi:unnamed protein product [Ilex paraguariensis]|uniref:WRKY domain-containing protein n=1 Tax=Ilex paraguariensis TaxID=185542 RepID=A0ABC8U6L4_9AQUA